MLTVHCAKPVALLLTALASCAAPGYSAQDDGTPHFDLDWFEGLSWREVGPYRGGRSAAVAGIPQDRETYYLGATGGGVWKTADAGGSWANVSDGFFGGSIGAVAVSEWDPNVVYVGGGEKTVRGNVSHGEGVWKSVDAGATWTHVGLPESRHVPRIRIHPRDPDLAYAAVLGHLYGPNGERGVYRTTDGGASWELVHFVSDEAGCVELVMDPTNPRVLYASFWNVNRTPSSLESGGEGSGLWKSTDGGDTWTELTGNPGLPGGVWGISGIAVSRSNPQNLYAIVENEDGGVFRSRDGGETWSRTNEERDLRQRAWYYSRIYADPVDEEGVYVLNVRFHHSVDGGRSFATISVPHGDNHDLWIDPADAERMIQSNDGGANVSFDRGGSWSTQANQPTAQMYRVSVDNAFPYRLLGGQQDNSAVRIRSRSLTGSSITRRDWDPTAGGESGHIVAKPDDPDVVYGGSYGGYLTRRNHRTGERRTVTVWPDNPMGAGAEGMKYRFQWNFPLFFSAHDPELLYAAANVLFRTRDGGASWEQVSPDLTRNDPSKLVSSGGPITQDNTGVEYYCTIFAAFESPHERGVIWCGSDDGRVHVTRDDGANWADVTPEGLPEWTQVNSLEPHPFEPGGAYLAGTRYKLDDFEPYLFRTTDYGATWERIDGGGIDRMHFTRVLRADPVRRGLLYAGTELGAYVSFDDGASWSSLQLDLPISPITDMAVKEGDLVVATQGRGYWILDDLSPLRQLDLEAEPGAVTLFEPRPSHRLAMRRTDSPRDAGTNAYPGVLFSYVLPDDLDPEATLELSILEADGTPIRTFEPRTPEGEEADPLPPHLTGDARQLPTEKGLNRFAWDLRYPGAETFEGAVYWNGGTDGPRAVPGDYRARLTVGDGDTAVVREVAFTLLPDPRTSATPDDFRAQFDFLSRVRDDLTRTHRAIRRLRAARGQIEAVKERFGDEHTELTEAADALLDDLKTVEETLYQTKAKSPQDPLNFPIRLGDKLAGLVGVAGSGDFAPTRQAREVHAFLMEGIEAELAKLDGLLGPRLDAFNASVQAAAVPAVVVEELEGADD
ncbi:MAG: glycosyl hydrolase [Planctomycetota bacterium]